MKSFYTTLLLLFFCTFSLFAQDGTLDSSFGDNGIKIVATPGEDARFYGLAKSGNQLVAAGVSAPNGTNTITVVGLDTDGNINTSFGTNGTLTIPHGTGAGQASCIIEQADGKFLVGGWARNSSKDEYVVARISADGVLDNSFGVDGLATGSFSSSSFAEDEIAAIGLLSDGKIVVTGRSYGGLSDDAFVGCFNPDGSLFTDFGTNGFSIIDFGTSPPSEVATALAIDANDNIFLGGTSSLGFNIEDQLFVMKLNNLGTPDASFGDAGKVFHAVDPDVIAGLNDIAIDAQGGIVTGGGAFNTYELDNNFFLTRFTSAGVLDNNFGNNGQVIIQRNSNESIFDLEILSSGDIIAAGSTGGFASGMAIVRFSSTGLQDPNFGTNGWAITQVGSTFNGISDIVVESGAIYAAGFSYSEDYQMTLAKYINAGMVSTNDIVEIATDVTVFPNPITDQFSVVFDLKNTSEISIDLVDVNGKRIQNLLPAQNLLDGKQQFSFELEQDLSAGIYFVVIQSEEGLAIRKVAK